MSEEEAIERLKERVKLDRKIRNNKIESDYEQFCENECQAIETILNLADKQQKEIEEKTTIIMAGAEKVKQLEKEIQRLEKDNDTLSELVIVNEDKVIKELDLISKDKIREKIKKAKEIKWQIPKLVIEYFEELLEENNE